MKLTKTTTYYIKTNTGYEIDREIVTDFYLDDDEDFPQDYWFTELTQVQFS